MIKSIFMKSKIFGLFTLVVVFLQYSEVIYSIYLLSNSILLFLIFFSRDCSHVHPLLCVVFLFFLIIFVNSLGMVWLEIHPFLVFILNFNSRSIFLFFIFFTPMVGHSCQSPPLLFPHLQTRPQATGTPLRPQLVSSPIWQSILFKMTTITVDLEVLVFILAVDCKTDHVQAG